MCWCILITSPLKFFCPMISLDYNAASISISVFTCAIFRSYIYCAFISQQRFVLRVCIRQFIGQWLPLSSFAWAGEMIIASLLPNIEVLNTWSQKNHWNAVITERCQRKAFSAVRTRAQSSSTATWPWNQLIVVTQKKEDTFIAQSKKIDTY